MPITLPDGGKWSGSAMEQTVPGMEEGLRAALPQFDSLLTEGQ